MSAWLLLLGFLKGEGSTWNRYKRQLGEPEEPCEYYANLKFPSPKHFMILGPFSRKPIITSLQANVQTDQLGLGKHKA